MLREVKVVILTREDNETRKMFSGRRTFGEQEEFQKIKTVNRYREKISVSVGKVKEIQKEKEKIKQEKWNTL